ncbi:unnamed protein product, partial [Mesorhabditis belari]|uniref:Autophagy protein 5 n=1 Tax=Mesorhabditis belari TaxID=2138241 RepID=A0AAF3ESD2_9BILA
MDYEVSRKVWDAKVPVEITLESEELADPVRPYYTMLSRCSYFTFVLPKAVQMFSTNCPNLSIDLDNVWLEYNRMPLKTYFPIGVLFDLLKEDESLPWRISLRTKNKPEGLSTVNRDMTQTMFMQAVKEADYLKRKGDMINCMKSDDHKQLWSALSQNQFDAFWSINRKLMECSDSRPFLLLPIRLYERGKSFKQAPIQPTTSGHPTTLEEAIKILDSDIDYNDAKFICHGIQIPLDTPVLWMTRNFAYPDNFVHMCLERKR